MSQLQREVVRKDMLNIYHIWVLETEYFNTNLKIDKQY